MFTVDDRMRMEAGEVWDELRTGLWHVTPSHRLREIARCGEIQPMPSLPSDDLIWAMQATTECRAAGAVSVFDIDDADWEEAQADSQISGLVRFIKGPDFVDQPGRWLSLIWIRLDRSKLSGLKLIRTVDEERKAAGNFERKWMPGLEGCHIGAIPMAAALYGVAICAVDVRRFQRISLDPAGLSTLDTLEHQWSQELEEGYELRGLSLQERIERIKLKAIEKLRTGGKD